MTLVLLIHEDKNNIQEIQIHINDVHKILGGKVTFVGQWPEIDVVIIRAVHASCINENVLPPPFHEEEVMGKILLVRMDEHSEPQDFTKEEFTAWAARTPSP